MPAARRGRPSESLVQGPQKDVADIHVFGGGQAPDDGLRHLLRLEGRAAGEGLVGRLAVAKTGNQEELRLHEAGGYQGHPQRDLACSRLRVRLGLSRPSSGRVGRVA